MHRSLLALATIAFAPAVMALDEALVQHVVSDEVEYAQQHRAKQRDLNLADLDAQIANKRRDAAKAQMDLENASGQITNQTKPTPVDPSMLPPAKPVVLTMPKLTGVVDEVAFLTLDGVDYRAGAGDVIGDEFRIKSVLTDAVVVEARGKRYTVPLSLSKSR